MHFPNAVSPCDDEIKTQWSLTPPKLLQHCCKFLGTRPLEKFKYIPISAINLKPIALMFLVFKSAVNQQHMRYLKFNAR